MSEDIGFSLPGNVDEVRDLDLCPIGKNKKMKIVASEVKENSSNTGGVWNLQFEDMENPNTKTIYDYRSLPRPVDIEGAASNEGYIDEKTGRRISADECKKRIMKSMISVTEVVKAFGVQYKNVRGKSQIMFESAIGKTCDNCEVVVKAATYKDGNPELPVPDPTMRGTELDPNFGRDKWDEDRRIILPKLPKPDQVK